MNELHVSARLLSVREVASLLSVREDVVRYLLRERLLDGFKVSGQWRIHREALAEFLIEMMSK